MQLGMLMHPELRLLGAISRKGQQMRIALALERRWTKGEILEAYLNLVPFRGEVEGVGAAASILCGKSPHGVTEAEALVLAVLLRSPNAGVEAVTRRAVALQRVKGSTVPRVEIMATVMLLADTMPGTGPRITLAPHVARRVLRTTVPFVALHSTLDAALQRVAHETLRRHLVVVRHRHVQDGAVVDNASGDVLAYVGGSGHLSSASYVDGVRARRQAGSTLKPFLYGLTFDQRPLTPASRVEDELWVLAVPGGLYRPQNYDEHFGGLVTARTALAASLNVPPVRVLAFVGVDGLVRSLRALGFASLTETGEYYGPALALGSAEVSLWELVNAYRTLADGGVWSPLALILDESTGQKFENRGVERQKLDSQEGQNLASKVESVDPRAGVLDPERIAALNS